jgi:hypothetical protein
MLQIPDDEMAEARNNLDPTEGSLFRDCLCPVTRLVCAEFKGSCRMRFDHEAIAPFKILQASHNISLGELGRLEEELTELNPFELKEAIERKRQKAKERRLAA